MSNTEKKFVGVIPARYNSSRLPGKPLASIGNKKMIQHVYERACESSLDRIIVATDDKRIFDEVALFGGEVIMTSPDHKSGTSRVAEVAEKLDGFDYYINIQGDQPFLKPETLEEIKRGLLSIEEPFAIATLITELKEEEMYDESVAKVVIDVNNIAMYFSRSPIPFSRDGIFNKNICYKHLGIYGYTKTAILNAGKMKESELEKTEKLEQLTWLYNRIPVYTFRGSDKDKFSVDTPEDLKRARKEFKNVRRG